jgi:hypothetical protein
LGKILTTLVLRLVEPLEAVGGADASAVALRERQASEALLDVLLDVLGDLLVALLAPLLGHAGSDGQGRLLGGRSEDTP